MRESLFWIAVVTCVTAQALIVRSTWRGRSRAAGDALPAGVPRPRAGMEVAWVLLPAVMLLVVLAFTWRAVRETAASPSPAPSAHQRDVAPRPL